MIIDDIQLAIDTGATIEIEYTKPYGESSIRKLSDIAFTDKCGDASEYIEAFCHLRQELRTFKISRINRVTFLSGVTSDEDELTQSVIITPTNVDLPYVFDSSKRIYKLYGEDYNF